MRIHPRLLASHAPKSLPIPPFRPPPPPAPPGGPTSGAASGSGPSKSQRSAPPPPTSTLPKPRPDYARLLADPAQTTQNHQLRASGLLPDHVSHVSRLRATQLALITKLDNVRRKQREVGKLIKQGLGERDELVRQATKFKVRIGEYETVLSDTEDELLELSLALPNFSSASTPIGAEENAREIETFGPVPLPADQRRDHLRVAERFGLLDAEAGAVAAGASWLYLTGAAALLELALINYAVSIAVKRGYTPVVPPDVVKTDIAARCGFLPRDSGGAQQTYTLSPAHAHDGHPTHCLAGTAEVPLAALFADKVYALAELPRKVVGVGHAFRAEAGARGADTRGMYRVHQFTKVELFAVTRGEEAVSEDAMQEMLATQKEIVQGLGLSTRVLEMPTQELGATASRKVDMEAWMPGRGKWGEITSTSNCTDYQSRRLHIRHRRPPPPPGPDLAAAPASSSSTDPLPFAHTLNGTAAAIPRLILALLENGARFAPAPDQAGQGSEGKALGEEQPELELVGLDLPKVLQRFWVGGEEIGEGNAKGTIRWV